MTETYDVVAVGIGPFNLALAALADELPELRIAAYDAKPRFDWHPGVLFDWATVQVGFLADLVSLVRPTSRWSFLSYLVDRDRMYQFYVAERFHLPRREYADYCRWAAERLPSTHFGTEVVALERNDGDPMWTVWLRDAAGERCVAARNVVLGVGTRPVLPAPLRPLRGDRVIHSAEYLSTVEGWGAGVRHVAVVGSGQSGAEVFLDLLRRQRECGWAVSWLSRTASFAPLDYSKLVLEYTTPEYMRYFHGLSPAVRDRLIGNQWQLYKGIDSGTIDAIHAELYHRLLDDSLPPVRLYPGTAVRGASRAGCGDAVTGGGAARGRGVVRNGDVMGGEETVRGEEAASGGDAASGGGAVSGRDVGGGAGSANGVGVVGQEGAVRGRGVVRGGDVGGAGVELVCAHEDTGGVGVLAADAVVAATGYAATPPALLDPVRSLLDWDERGRYRIDREHRIRTVPTVSAGLYVQNAELHTHGAAAPDLGVGAYRAATILNAITGRETFRLPQRTAFQTFGGVR